MGTHEISDTLYVTTCCTCGIVFGIPDRFDNALRRNGSNFHCPNGHTLAYSSGKNLEEWKNIADEHEKEIKELKTKITKSTHHIDQLSARLEDEILEKARLVDIASGRTGKDLKQESSNI